MNRVVIVSLLLSLALSAVFASFAHTEPAPTNTNAFKVFVSQAGVEYGRTSIALPIVDDLKAQVLAENFKNRLPADKTHWEIKVPSNVVTDFVRLGGKTITQFSLTEIRITQFDFSRQKTGLVYGADKNSVTIQVADLALTVKAVGSWDGRPVVASGGVQGITARLTAKFAVDNFKPSISIVSGQLVLNEQNLNLRLEQGLGKLGDWAVNTIIDKLKPTASEMIHKQFEANYQKPNEVLKKIFDSLVLTKVVKPADLPKFPPTLGDNFKITKPIIARISLNNPPEFTPAGLSLFFDAHTYTEGNTQCSRTCRPRATPNPNGNTYVQVQISDFVPCCILTAAHELGLMNYRGRLDPVPKFELPAEYKAGLEPLVTAIIAKYKISYAITAKYVPQVNFGHESVKVTMNEMQVQVFVQDKEAGTAPKVAVDLTITAQIAASIRLAGNVIRPTLSSVSLKLGTFNSFLPEITDVIKAPLQNLIDVIIQTKVLPMANTMISKGFELPVLDGMTFVNPLLSLESGYIRVGTSFTYNKPIKVVLPDTHFLETDAGETDDEYKNINVLPPSEHFPIKGDVTPWPEDGSDDNLLSMEDLRVVSANEGQYDTYIDLDAPLSEEDAKAEL